MIFIDTALLAKYLHILITMIKYASPRTSHAKREDMKKLVLGVVLMVTFFPAISSAQTPSECSSIEQKFSQAPVVTGESSPANILMSSVGVDEFEFVVNANPGYSINFIQLVYTDTVSTRIVMPNTNEDFTTHWQTDALGTFEFYKVTGCLAKQASTTVSTASTNVVTTSKEPIVTTTSTQAQIIHPKPVKPVIVTPNFTG